MPVSVIHSQLTRLRLILDWKTEMWFTRRLDDVVVWIATLIVTCASFDSAFAQDASGAVGPPQLSGIAFSADGSCLIVGGDAVRVFRADTGELVDQIPVGRSRTSRAVVALTGPGNLFVHAGEDSIIRIRRVSEEQPVRELQGHLGQLRTFAISPDGKLVASVAGTIVGGHWTKCVFRLRDLVTGQALRTGDVESDDIDCVAFSRDGKQLALATQEKDKPRASQIEVLDVQNWKRLRSIACSPGFVSEIFFDGARGDMLIVGGDCQPVPNGCVPTGRIWIVSPDAGTAREVEQDREYAYFVAAQTPGADRLAIGTAVVTATVNAKGKINGARLGPLVQMRDTKTGNVLW